MTTKYAVQDRNTGKLFAGFVGLKGVDWTFSKDEAYQISRGQSQKVVDKLKREGQACAPQIVAFH